nr:hypothetical protein [Tanacetum cinerariifolium]
HLERSNLLNFKRSTFRPNLTLDAPPAKRANQEAPQVPAVTTQDPAGVPAAPSIPADASLPATSSSDPAAIPVPAVSIAHAAVFVPAEPMRRRFRPSRKPSLPDSRRSWHSRLRLKVLLPTAHGQGMSDQHRQELDAAQLIYSEANWLDMLAKIATKSSLSKQLLGDDITKENMNERLGMLLMLYQMDVKSAFLYGTIDEELYVMQPPGFQDPEYPARVYKVEKAMYGLHQAPRAWHGTLSKYLLSNGFQRGTIDQTLFIRRQRGNFILVQVYVDDIIFGSSNPQLCREFEALMHEKFQMSAMGELNFFLGLSSNTPMDKENPWGKDGTGKDVDLHLYRFMIGSLMYLTASRPDIMFTVCACAKHQVTPKECHLLAAKRIFRYLKGHPKLGLWYPKDSPFDLVAFSDSN